MSDFCVHLKVKPYLAQWVTHHMGSPVNLIKGSPEWSLLKILISRLPQGENYKIDDDYNLTIVLPSYEGKNPEYFNYLSDRGKAAMEECFQALFVQNMWKEIGPLQNCKCNLTNAIYTWLDLHGIEEDQWETIRQMYYRQRKRYYHSLSIKV